MAVRWLGLIYWFIVGLTFCAILILGFMASQALHEQAGEEIEKRLADARERVKQRAIGFFQELPIKLAGVPSLPFPLPLEQLPEGRFPETSGDLENFLLAANAASESRPILLRGLLDADFAQKPFWYLILACRAFGERDHESALHYLSRIQVWEKDYRLINGFSLKGLANLYEADFRNSSGSATSADQVLLRFAFLPSPTPDSLEAIEKTWLPKFERSDWFHFILWAWKQPSKAIVQPGWLEIAGRPMLVLAVQGKLRLFRGEAPFQELRKVLQNAVGERLTLETNISPNDSALDFTREKPIPGVAFQLSSSIPAAEPVPWRNRLTLGLTLSFGLVGIAALALFGLKRFQEQQLQEEKEWLFRQAAHDLKTPLAAIRALAETLSLQRCQSKAQELAYLEKIIREADYSADLIDSLLLIARLRSGVAEIHPKPVMLSETVNVVLERFSPRLEGWIVENAISADLQIFADSAMFERILTNLFENVIRHAGSGKTLTLLAEAESGVRLEFRIGDRGPGFLKHYTHPTPPTTHVRTGSGLGLALVKKLADLHRASIGVEPRDGGGSWVILRWAIGRG